MLARSSQSGEIPKTTEGQSLRRGKKPKRGRMTKDYLKCCGDGLILQNVEHHHFMDCFSSRKFFKKNLSDGRPVKKEIVLVTYCRQCKHYILKYLWYSSKNSDFWNFSETKDIRGKLADDVFNRYMDEWDLEDIPNPYLTDDKFIKHSKTVPWIYYKATSKTTAVPRYMDETGNAGRSIYSPITTINPQKNS